MTERGCFNGGSQRDKSCSRVVAGSYVGGLSGCKVMSRNDEKGEANRKKSKAFGRSCLLGSISYQDRNLGTAFDASHNDTVISCEYGQLIQPCHQVPTRSDVACNEDTECKNGERVHQRAFVSTYESSDVTRFSRRDLSPAVDNDTCGLMEGLVAKREKKVNNLCITSCAWRFLSAPRNTRLEHP